MQMTMHIVGWQLKAIAFAYQFSFGADSLGAGHYLALVGQRFFEAPVETRSR